MTSGTVKDDSLDLLVPNLSDRWPEPRLLWQRDVWFMRHRTRGGVGLDRKG